MGYGQKQATYGRGFDWRVWRHENISWIKGTWHFMTFRHCKLWKYQHWRMCTKSRPSPCHPLCRKLTFRFTIYPRLDPLEPARGTGRKQKAFQIQISQVHCLFRNQRVSWCLQPFTIFAEFRLQILMLSLPLPIHLLDRLLDFGVTFSLN